MILKSILSYKHSVTITTTIIGMASLIFSTNLYSDDLLTIYSKAAKRDPIIAQAQATYESERQNLPIAVAELLPQLFLRAGINRDKILDLSSNQTNSIKTTNATKRTSPTVRSKYFALNLSQSLFEWDKIQKYLQSEYVVQKAMHDLEAAKQDLLIRISEAYFNILQAEDILEYTKTEKIAINEMYKQAQARFDVGLIAVADVEEAKARYNAKSADEIKAANDIANKYEDLNAIVGEKIQQIDILSPSFKADYPKPSIMEKWVAMAIKRNHTLMSQELAYCVMEKNEDIAFAGHLPNVKLNARYTGREGNRSIIIDEISTVKGYINTYGASIDGSWELFASGGTQAKINQARFNTYAEGFNTEKVRRGIISDTRQSYRNIVTSLSQIKALEVAQLSSVSALDATKAGYDLGTRASIDVLNRLTDLYNQKQRLAIAKYTYIKNIIKLKQDSGILSNEDMAVINKWLVTKDFKNKNHLDKTDVRETILQSMKNSDEQRTKEIKQTSKDPIKTDIKKTGNINTDNSTIKPNGNSVKTLETNKNIVNSNKSNSSNDSALSTDSKKIQSLPNSKDISKSPTSGLSGAEKKDITPSKDNVKKIELCPPNTVCDKIQSNIKKSEIDSYLNLELPSLDDEDDLQLGINIKELPKPSKKIVSSKNSKLARKESTARLEEKLQQIIADYKKNQNEN